jgi:hypothetical protein
VTPDERTLACQAEVLPEARCGAVRCGSAARRAVGFATDDVLAAALSISRCRVAGASSWPRSRPHPHRSPRGTLRDGAVLPAELRLPGSRFAKPRTWLGREVSARRFPSHRLKSETARIALSSALGRVADGRREPAILGLSPGLKSRLDGRALREIEDRSRQRRATHA